MPPVEAQERTWRLRGRTLEAMALLCAARLLIGLVPFRRWRRALGWAGAEAAQPGGPRPAVLARHVERAASRLPFEAKCLPRAMALSWMLRRRKIGHAIVLAARPASRRDAGDDLHSWVEKEGRVLIGELPGPWIEVWRAGR